MSNQYAAIKTMLEMQKSAIQSMINGMIVLWDQTERMLNNTVGVPEEGKNAIRQWIEINKKGCENIKAAMDTGYANFERIFDESQ